MSQNCTSPRRRRLMQSQLLMLPAKSSHSQKHIWSIVRPRLTSTLQRDWPPALQRDWPLLYSEIDLYFTARLTPFLQFFTAEMKYGMQNIFLIQIFVVNYKVLVGNLWPHPALINWLWYGCWLFQEKPYAISTFSHIRAMYQVMTHRICELMRLQVCSDSGMNAILCFYKINWK